jgi:hypothetical protein
MRVSEMGARVNEATGKMVLSPPLPLPPITCGSVNRRHPEFGLVRVNCTNH